jgi:hypothetical protein
MPPRTAADIENAEAFIGVYFAFDEIAFARCAVYIRFVVIAVAVIFEERFVPLFHA